MKFERIIDGKDYLWAVRDMNKPNNELAALFQIVLTHRKNKVNSTSVDNIF